MKKLSIIIPCYNESKTVREILEKVETVTLPSGWNKEIIVIDDGSKDGTSEILREFINKFKVLTQLKNGGKGTAVKLGMDISTGDYLIIQDADLEYDPKDYGILLGAIDDNKCVVFGSRNLRKRYEVQHSRYIPIIGVWFITKMINIFYNLNLTDVWTCYKLFPREAIDLFKTGGFESELLFITALAKKGYKFKEMPISYYPRRFKDGKKITYWDGIKSIILLIIDRFNIK